MLSVSQPGQPPTGWGPAPPGWGPPPQPGPAPAYGSYGWGGPPPAPKPGVAPLRPLGVGDILEATLSILRRYPGAAFGSAAVVVGTVTLLQLAVLWPTITTLTTLPDPVDPASGQQWIDAVTERRATPVSSGSGRTCTGRRRSTPRYSACSLVSSVSCARPESGVQVQPRHLLVEVLGQHVHPERVVVGLGEQLDLGQHLVGERVGHHEAGARWRCPGSAGVPRTAR
jgi:hypothetical protein